MPGHHKYREQCSATRRDGQPCQALTVPHLLVCRAHGGGTPDAQILSQHLGLQMRRYIAEREWLEARGTKGYDAALTRYGNAQSELRYFEERLAYLRELQAKVRARKAEGAWTPPASESPYRRLRKFQRQADEQRRWKPRAVGE